MISEFERFLEKNHLCEIRQHRSEFASSWAHTDCHIHSPHTRLNQDHTTLENPRERAPTQAKNSLSVKSVPSQKRPSRCRVTAQNTRRLSSLSLFAHLFSSWTFRLCGPTILDSRVDDGVPVMHHVFVFFSWVSCPTCLHSRMPSSFR